jgi:uncharacterized protein (DUF302 family)
VEVSEYGYRVEVREGYDEAVVRTRLALRGEGFSILTEAHVGGMLGPVSGDRQYLIMGAWNAQMTQDVGGSGVQAAVQLACNVVVQEHGDEAIVAALDPVDSLELSDGPIPEPALAARGALERALQRVAADS